MKECLVAKNLVTNVAKLNKHSNVITFDCSLVYAVYSTIHKHTYTWLSSCVEPLVRLAGHTVCVYEIVFDTHSSGRPQQQ